MKKTILMGSTFVLALVVLMPAIPAVCYKTIDDTKGGDFGDEFNFVDFRDFMTLDSDLKYPVLYVFVISVYYLRATRGAWFYYFGDDYWFGAWWYSSYLTPRGERLMETAVLWLDFWDNLSDTYGWNWDLKE